MPESSYFGSFFRRNCLHVVSCRQTFGAFVGLLACRRCFLVAARRPWLRWLKQHPLFVHLAAENLDSIMRRSHWGRSSTGGTAQYCWFTTCQATASQYTCTARSAVVFLVLKPTPVESSAGSIFTTDNTAHQIPLGHVRLGRRA